MFPSSCFRTHVAKVMALPPPIHYIFEAQTFSKLKPLFAFFFITPFANLFEIRSERVTAEKSSLTRHTLLLTFTPLFTSHHEDIHLPIHYPSLLPSLLQQLFWSHTWTLEEKVVVVDLREACCWSLLSTCFSWKQFQEIAFSSLSHRYCWLSFAIDS